MPTPDDVKHRKRTEPRGRAFLGLLLMLAVGCPQSDRSQDADETTSPYAGAEVRVVVPTGLNLASGWRPGFEDWAAQRSASYTFSEIDFSETSSAPQDWLTAVQKQSPTLVLLPTPLVNRLVVAGLAAPIPESALEVLAWSRIPPSVRKALGMRGDQPAVYPVTCPTLVAFYRKDLLDAAGRKLPQTWDEYDALVASVSEWAPDHIAIEPRANGTLATLFLARAAVSAKLPTQYSFELDVSTGQPLISSGAFVRTLERMSALTAHLSSDSESASFEDVWTSLRSCKAAIGITALLAAPAETGVGRSGEAGAALEGAVIEFAPLPGSRSVFMRDTGEWTATERGQLSRPALCGFAGLSVCVMESASEVEQAAAWDLWAALAGYQDDGVIPPPPGVPCRTSAIASAVGQFDEALSAGSLRSLEQALTANQSNLQLIAELPCIDRARLLAVLTDALYESLHGGIPPATALAQAAGAWTTIIDDIGRSKVLNSYRQRRGLTPLP